MFAYKLVLVEKHISTVAVACHVWKSCPSGDSLCTLRIRYI